MLDPEIPKRMKGVGRVAFLKHRAEIEAELNDGWPLKAIYEKRQAALGFSYQHFVRYVNAIIRGARPDDAAPIPQKPEPARPRLSPASLAQEDNTHARHDDAGRRSGFKYDPNPSNADRARLIGGGDKDE